MEPKGKNQKRRTLPFPRPVDVGRQGFGIIHRMCHRRRCYLRRPQAISRSDLDDGIRILPRDVNVAGKRKSPPIVPVDCVGIKKRKENRKQEKEVANKKMKKQ